MLRRLIRVFGWVVAGVAIILAIVITALRFELIDIQPYRAQLLKSILPAGLQGQMGDIKLSWQSARLQTQMRDIAISSTDPAIPISLSAQQLTFSCQVWSLLQSPRHCALQLNADGVDVKWTVNSTHSSASADVQPTDLLNQFLQQVNGLQITNSRVHLLQSQHEFSALNINTLKIRNTSDQHQFFAQLALQQQSVVVPLTVQAELIGPPDWQKLSGHIYAATHASDATQSIQTLLPAPLAVNAQSLHGKVDFQLWAERDPGHWKNALLQLGENSLGWQQDAQAHELGVKGGSLLWQQTPAGWQLTSQDVQLHHDDRPWRHWQVNLTQQQELFSGAIDPLYVDELTPLVRLLLPAESAGNNALKTMMPNGLIHDVQFTRQEESGDWLLSGRLDDLSWNRWQMVPAVRQLDSAFQVSAKGATIQLDGLPAQNIDLHPYFEADWPVTQLSGQIQFNSTPEGWRLQAQQMQFDTKDIQTKTDFVLSQTNAEPMMLQLNSLVDLPDVSKAHFYFPHGAMGEGAISYLTKALRQGEAKQAAILWHGTFHDFPYREHQGVFQAFVPVRKAVFQFGDGWQPLHDLSLDLLFENDRLDMTSHDAKLGDAQIPSIHAYFDKLAPDSHLKIDAEIGGTGEAVSQYLIDSPLKSSVGAALTSVQISKPIRGKLKLDIPLTGDDVKTEGEVAFDQNQLNLPSMNLRFDQVSGVLKFDDQHTSAESLSARLWNQPLKIQYQGVQNPKSYDITLGFEGNFDSKLDRDFTAITQSNFNGNTAWKGDLAVNLYPGGHFNYKANFNSSLNGMALSLPFPFQKVAARSWPTSLRIRGNQESSVIDGSLNKEWRLNAEWLNQQKQFTRFWLDNEIIPRDNGPKLPMDISAIVSRADLSEWMSFFSRLPQRDSGSASLFPSTGSIKVELDQFAVANQTWRNVEVRVTPDQQGRRIWIDSNNAQGQILIPNTKQMATADFRRLYWAESTSETDEPPIPLEQQQRWLAGWPSLQFSCQDCRYGGNTLGSLNATLVPVKNGGELRDIQWSVANSTFAGSAGWLIEKQQPQSFVKGKIETKNTEILLSHFGKDIGLTGTAGQATFDIHWPGALIQPEPGQMNGDLKAEFSEGILKDVKNSNGNRLLSLFSLNAIIQRISFDFRDVFNKGLYFKKISFSGKLNDGLLKNDDLLLESHSGELNGEGEINLKSKQIDYQVTFSPQITSGFGVATAFAVTPVTGVVVLAASKILQPVFDAITEVNYTIHGPLLSPDIKETSRKTGKVSLTEKK